MFKRTEFNHEKRLLSADEAAAYIGRGRGSMAKFMKEIGAVRKFGRRVVYDKKVIDKALDEMEPEGKGYEDI